MITRSKLVCSLLLLALTGLTYGCGGGSSATTAAVDTTSVRSGSVVQGPVSGSTVFADNVASGVGTRFFLDAGSEVVAALSDSTGKYLLPTFPSYDFILVSYGGTDQITGQPQILLLAPAGAANITPLTTLVTLDTTVGAKLKPKLAALMNGASYDTRIDTGATPAALLLAKTVETAVKSLTDTVVSVVAPAGSTISQKQINYIQGQVLQQIALECANSPLDLAVPANLNTIMRTAMANAFSAITSVPANSNITLDAVTLVSGKTAPQNIADNAVAAAAIALGTTGSSIVALSTTTIKVESTLLNVATAFNTAVTATMAQAASAMVATSTPSNFSPAPLQVVTTISATIIKILTGATGGSTTGVGVTF